MRARGGTSRTRRGALRELCRVVRPGGHRDAEPLGSAFLRPFLEGLLDRLDRYGYGYEKSSSPCDLPALALRGPAVLSNPEMSLKRIDEPDMSGSRVNRPE